MALTPKISLNKFNWWSGEKISVTGFTWFEGEYLAGEAFAGLIKKNSDNFGNFKRVSALLNGQFAVVVESGSEVWLMCSHTWSYPLFYRTKQNTFLVSDDPEKLVVDRNGESPGTFTELYFYVFGVTPSFYTLNDHIFQVRPGEVVRLAKDKPETFLFLSSSEFKKNKKPGLSDPENLYQLFLGIFGRYYSRLKNRRILLPLTRGYDSRLLACLLKQFGHKNVICATWGRTGNSELATAQKVAGQLGFEHIFVDYSREVKNGFIDEPGFYDYIRYAGHLSSMPYLQDYFAVKILKEKGIIDENTVVLPGHPGDFLRGSHLDAEFTKMDAGKLALKIISKFGSSLPVSYSQKTNIRNFISESFFKEFEQQPWKGFEMWDLEERQCKFIANSTSVFSFFGLEHMMPLFDKEALRFFSNVPVEQKLGAKLYNQTLEKYFFEPNNVSFDLKPATPKGNRFSGLKERILFVAPRFLKNWYYPLEDTIFYREITGELRQSGENFKYRHPAKPHFYNSYLIQWYLRFVKN